MKIIGVDPALKGLAITTLTGGLEEDGTRPFDFHWIPTHQLKTKDEWKRATYLHQAFRDFLRKSIVASGAPRGVFIEAPIIHATARSSVIILIQVSALLRLACDETLIPTFMVANSSWKQHVALRGGASKQDTAAMVDIQLPGFTGRVADLKIPKAYWEDCYDSAGVALYGWNTVQRVGA